MSLCQEGYRSDFTHVSKDTVGNEIKFTPSQSKWITRTNEEERKKGKRFIFTDESSFFFLARNSRKQRIILTEALG